MVKRPSFIALYWPDRTDDVQLLKLVDELAKKDARSRSWVLRQAAKEYVKAHYPGNPQTDMRVFTGDLEPPKTTRESNDKEVWRLMRDYGLTKDEALKKLTG